MSIVQLDTSSASRVVIQRTWGSNYSVYVPFGELFIEERTTWNTPYKFSGKELDEETGYNYHGARYLDPGISIWLSVDPLADLFPGYSPYNYTLNNPLRLIDPNGMGPIKTPDGEETNVGEGYQATSDGKYLHGEGLPTKVWNPELDYGPGSGSSGKGGYEDYIGEPLDFSSYGSSNGSPEGNRFSVEEKVTLGTAAISSSTQVATEIVDQFSGDIAGLTKKVGTKFSLVQIGITTYSAVSDREFSVGDGARVAMSGLSLVPGYGWAYGAADFLFLITSGESLTDRIGGFVDLHWGKGPQAVKPQ
jgi:RHS repeat-associated protein